MTVHASKGLESECVFYVHNSGGRGEQARFPVYQRGRVAFDVLGKGQVADELAEIYLEEYLEEEKRLAYVACTRAKKKFVFVSLGEKPKEGKVHWNAFINQELIANHSFYGSRNEVFDGIEVRNDDASAQEDDDKAYYERFEFLTANTAVFREIPQFLSVSLLLDAEFNPKQFYDKYLRRSFDLVDSLRELADEEFSIKTPSQQDIGSLLHKVLQDFDNPPKDELLEYLESRHPEKSDCFAVVVDYAYGYWESDFYKDLRKDSGWSVEKEKQVTYILPNDIIIRAVADLHYSRDKDIIVDYKLSVGKNLERYQRQLSYYALLSEQCGQKVDEIVLFSMKDGKEYPLIWDRDETKEKFDTAVNKAMELLTSKETTISETANTAEIIFKDTLF